ncbi:beta-lactamase class A [Sphingomonas guangdongensis]|uniref:Beta-lactamase n=1 Tax=Sphingomonas guangdongensis TaxID=1141890 RepID=A0A285QXF5_9SPHN|nr:class A beta-lactamase [Sphingomonas guangdongensis]SOB86640.1 beta-lactamase class A [Sphingomonas guangdongensis]
MDRREVLVMLGAAGVAAAILPERLYAAGTPDFGGARFAATLADIDRRAPGRLGVAVLDFATGQRFALRGGERFPMCSTFKFPLSAAVLHAADRGRLPLDRAVAVRRGDIIANSPVTARRVGGSMRVAALCHATMTTSDNAAANLLLPLIGGADGFNAFLRAAGDRVTRLDRIEPHLNEGTPGDPRDTTTPAAMLATMRATLFGSVLSAASRQRLIGWLVANTTGGRRLRAGLPAGWRVGDKTGTGETSANDIGVLWPRPGRAPILVASYLTEARGSQVRRYAVHAEVARAIAAAVR